MARPDELLLVPDDADRDFRIWRDRVLTWPVPVDGPAGLTLANTPTEYRERVLWDLLEAKAERFGPDHWSTAILKRGHL